MRKQVQGSQNGYKQWLSAKKTKVPSIILHALESIVLWESAGLLFTWDGGRKYILNGLSVHQGAKYHIKMKKAHQNNKMLWKEPNMLLHVSPAHSPCWWHTPAEPANLLSINSSLLAVFPAQLSTLQTSNHLSSILRAEIRFSTNYLLLCIFCMTRQAWRAWTTHLDVQRNQTSPTRVRSSPQFNIQYNSHHLQSQHTLAKTHDAIEKC